jgi:hypothetical protein
MPRNSINFRSASSPARGPKPTAINVVLKFVSSSYSNNTIWGSRQTGGSSGGPEVVNLGRAAALNGATFGTDSTFNTVVGVTSWDTDAIKEQGASPFTSNNISVLVNLACTAYPANCK